MALQMAGKQGRPEKQLAKDTAIAIDLCRHLLATSHKYVLFV